MNFAACVITFWVLAIKDGGRIYNKALKDGETTSSRWVYMHTERRQNFFYPEFLKVMPKSGRLILLIWLVCSVALFLGHDFINAVLDRGST